MTTNPLCISEQNLIDLYYEETDSPEECRRHLDVCPTCRQAWTKLQKQMQAMSDPLPRGGDRALAGALKMLGLQETAAPRPAPNSGKPPAAGLTSSDIMTLPEVAAYLRVELEQVRELLHELPHLNIGGAIRVRRPALEAFMQRMEAESTRRTLVETVTPMNRKYDLI